MHFRISTRSSSLKALPTSLPNPAAILNKSLILAILQFISTNIQRYLPYILESEIALLHTKVPAIQHRTPKEYEWITSFVPGSTTSPRDEFPDIHLGECI
jgi:hypothetical protein